VCNLQSFSRGFYALVFPANLSVMLYRLIYKLPDRGGNHPVSNGVNSSRFTLLSGDFSLTQRNKKKGHFFTIAGERRPLGYQIERSKISQQQACQGRLQPARRPE
jgi:hypothetical protein